MPIPRFLILFGLSFAVTHSAWAEAPKVIELASGDFYVVKGVNVRNGNFAVTYRTSQDDSDPSGIPFDRIYNSKSERQGSFGLGWGTAMDNAVSFLADGTLEIQENGSGARTSYRLLPHSPGQEYLEDEAIKRRYMTDSDNTVLAVKERLRKQLVKAKQIADEGPIELLSLGPIPDRAVFSVQNAFEGDVCREGSRIRREGERMIREFGAQCPTASETYTLGGALIGVQSRQNRIGASLTVTRDPKSALVTALTDEKGKVTRFKYDARKRLVHQEYPTGEKQTFEYDARDNMTTIIYVDDSKQRMTYDDQDRALSVSPRSGPAARFEYMPDPYDPAASITRVTLSEGEKKDVIVFKVLK